jgi:hypothetical protein
MLLSVVLLSDPMAIVLQAARLGIGHWMDWLRPAMPHSAPVYALISLRACNHCL